MSARRSKATSKGWLLYLCVAIKEPYHQAGSTMARPTDFKEEYVSQAQKLCKLGATDQELADFFEVSVRTIYRWKGDHEAFCQALKAGKTEADDRVERSLFARANGYEHDEVDIRVIGQEVIQTPIRKFYPPDTTACIFWLKNRRAAEWRDKVEQEVTGSVKHDHSVALSAETTVLLAGLKAGSSDSGDAPPVQD